MDQQTVQSIVGRERYTVQRLLGRGGMSTVWLAEDHRHSRLVAIKMLNQELGNNPEFRQRFRNEAAAAQSVNSPNVVQIYQYQEGSVGNHDACYIVMEYIRGESLSQVLHRRATLPEHLALDVLEQTAHGLSAIHAANLVHRDIKPGNLLVTPEGTVKITDFGIAKAAEAVPLTRTGMVVGTAQYVSPEQAQGKHVNPATDIYSLGCVAYEMVSGQRPFVGDTTVAVAVAHINQPPPALAPTVNPHIRELIGIMLRKDPARRYADGRELANAVLRVRAGSRPPQPRGEQPAVYRQSNAAHPATSELGAMTRPGQQDRYQQARVRPTPLGSTGAYPSTHTGHAAVTRTGQSRGMPAQRTNTRHTKAGSAPQGKSRPKARNAGAGCGWMLLMVLLVLLAGAIAIVYSLFSSGTIPGFPQFSGETSQSSEQAPDTSDEQSWDSGNDTGGYGNDGTDSGHSNDWGGGASSNQDPTDAGSQDSTGSNGGHSDSGSDSGNAGNNNSGNGGGNGGTGNGGNGGGTSDSGSGGTNGGQNGGSGAGNGSGNGTSNNSSNNNGSNAAQSLSGLTDIFSGGNP